MGPALEDWLAKKHQYETFQDVKGNSCTVTDDSAIAALFKLMPQTFFDNLQMQVEEYDDWRDLFDRLQSYASYKVGINITDRPAQVGCKNDGPVPMDIGNYNRKQNVTCWECGKQGHYGRDCWHRGKGKGKGKNGNKGNIEGGACKGNVNQGKGFGDGKGKGEG